MAIRALMVDVDGVLIRHPEGVSWSSTLEQDLGVDRTKLRTEFFQPFFADLALGRGDLADRLAEVLARIAPDVDADTLIRYWFERDSPLDLDLLEGLADLRRDGVELHLATTQEARRAAYLWDGLGLKDHFDAMHVSAEIGHAKPSLEFHRAAEQRSGFAPSELLLIDDREENVDGARRAGWAAHLWTPRSTLADVPVHNSGDSGAG